MLITVGRDYGPRCPWEIREEVEKYARESGRTATMHFAPGAGWFARFSLKPNDKRMLLYQQGLAPEPPTEDVWFNEPIEGRPGHYRPLDIIQMGPSGVREFLERGNTWSGRGQYQSLEDALRQTREANQQEREKAKAEAQDRAKMVGRDVRRSRMNIPFVGVGIDLGDTSTTTESE